MFATERPHVAHSSPPRPPQISIDGLPAALIDLIDFGLCACDTNGLLLHANRAAHRELARGRVLMLVDGVVRSAGGLQTELLNAFRDAAQRQKNHLLVIGDAQDRLVAVTLPIALGGGSGEQAALLMLGQRSACSPITMEMLSSRHDLTPTERRVLAGLLANQSPREIATNHRVSLPTIRTQIQSLREKIGVRSVDELLLFAARLPPVSTRFDSVAS